MAFEIPPYFQEKVFPQVFLWGKKQWTLASAAVVGGITLLVAYAASGPDPLSYVKAEEAFAKWDAASENNTLFLDLKRALRNAPNLTEKYRAEVAQKLLNGERVEEAALMAEYPLRLLREEAPFHASFGETSLLIERKSFQEALESAVSLKEKMQETLNIPLLSHKNPVGGGALLYAQNLLRIAFLQKELGNRPGEKAAWDEVELFLKNEEAKPVADVIYANFKEKGVDLTTFIEMRRSDLESQK